MSVVSVVRRALPDVVRTGRRMCDPVSGVPLRSLVVVDVDLDLDVVIPIPAHTPFESPPEGVHALVWFHGAPVGDVTLQGDPAQLLEHLAATAREILRPALVAHLLDDALATAGGVALAREQGLRAVAHPARSRSSVPAPTVTVAVCTRDRPEMLHECLSALAALDHPVLEVLVVDNGSRDDRTRAVATSFPFVRYVVEPRPGLDWARNRALLEARGKVIAYTDDDVLVHPGWVSSLLQAFTDEPEAVAVTGLVVPAELSTPAQVLFEVHAGFGRGYHRRWFAAAVGCGEVAAGVFGGSGEAGTGANMAFHRDRLLALGGFDVALDVGTLSGGGGDLEAFFRVVAAGDLLVYEPRAVVRHRHRSDLPALKRQIRGDGTGSTCYQLGAGRLYGPRDRRSFTRIYLWWFLRGHLRRLLTAARAPELMPPSVPAAEVRGAFDAALGRYYRRGLQEAERLPGPRLHPVRPSPRPLLPRRKDRVVSVDLLADPPLTCTEPIETGPTRRLRIRVLRGGVLQHVIALWTHALPVSSAQLRTCLVDALGPAILVPGLGWEGSRGRLHGRERPAQLAAIGLGRGPRDPDREVLCDLLLQGGVDPPKGTCSGGAFPVTIVVVTVDCLSLLSRCLTALDTQDTARDRQVVVVDSSPDPARTAAVVQAHPGVELVREPLPGSSRARNAGVAHATGDVVVFLDGAVVPATDWLERLLIPLNDPTVAVSTGNALPCGLDALAPQILEDYGGLSRGPHRKLYRPSWLRMHGGAVPTWEMGGNTSLAVRRDVLDALGPWIESLGDDAPATVGGDTEYLYRVLRAGGSIVYEPTAVVLHGPGPDLDRLEAQLHDYAVGHVGYLLEVARRYRDFRGLRRILLALPRHLLLKSRASSRGHDDVPRPLLRAEVRGSLAGPATWVRSSWAHRR